MKRIFNKNTYILVASIILCQLAGIIGSVFTVSSISTWYAELTKPTFNPPNWIFGPVWTTLYLLMGISLYLIWRELYSKKKDVNVQKIKSALEFFSLQLIFNILWSIIFFGFKTPFTAFFEIIILWILILLTIINFYKINRTAGILLIPYILWCTFAAVLNLAIAILN